MILDTFDQSGTKTYMDIINPISFSGAGGGVLSASRGVIKKMIRGIIRSIIKSIVEVDE